MAIPTDNNETLEDPQEKPKGPPGTKGVRVVPIKTSPTNQPIPSSVESASLTTEEDTGQKDEDKLHRFWKGINPRKKLSAFEMAARNSPRLKVPLKYRLRPDPGLVRRAAWDLSAILSLLVNAVLLTVVVLLSIQVKNMKSSMNNLLGGLYDNFVRMDNSVISTTVTMPEMSIPLDFILPVVQSSTNMTLTENVTIHGAYVIINTGSLSINSAATITLPAGTTLPVSLSIDVPVKTTVLVKDIQVPIDIRLAKANSPDPNVANLHSAFIGLQDTVGPFYCLLQPEVQDYTGVYLCQQGAYILRSR
jgi:hypothetical protein